METILKCGTSGCYKSMLTLKTENFSRRKCLELNEYYYVIWERASVDTSVDTAPILHLSGPGFWIFPAAVGVFIVHAFFVHVGRRQSCSMSLCDRFRRSLTVQGFDFLFFNLREISHISIIAH